MTKFALKTLKYGMCSALALTAGSGLALAQEAADAEAEDTKRLNRVTVTAQRREETALSVPLSVSAFDSETLQTLAVNNITEVTKLTPNITIEVARGTNSTISAFIRGVGQQDPIPGFEPGVGIYVDDVYLARPQGAVLEVYDVERVEVLRGPQGTLYGRNTIGGAVKYVTKSINPDEATLGILGTYGTFNQVDLVVKASVPITDRFRVGAAAAHFGRDGFGENLFLGIDNYNKDIVTGRLSAELDVTDDIQIRLAGDWMEDTSNARQGSRLIPGQFSGAQLLDDVFDTQAGLNVVDQFVEAYGGSAIVEWRVNENLTLKNIFSYREDFSSSPIDFDSLPAQDVEVPVFYENDQLSEEFQILWNSDRLNGIVGFYYLNANAASTFDVLLGLTGDLLGLPGLNAQTLGDVNTDTWSVFADFTYDLTDQISVSLGGRYTEDTRNSTILRTTFLGGFSDVFRGAAVPIATTSDFNGEETFRDFNPRVSLAWQPNADNNLYFTYSQGFKGGSFDPRGQSSAAPDLDGDGDIDSDDVFNFLLFQPETVDSFEIGWKTSQLDGRLTSNAAVFYTDYTDVQVPGSVGVDTDGDGVNDTFAGITSNAGAATIWGIEWDVFFNVGSDIFTDGDYFDLYMTLGYIDAQYDEFIDAFGVDIADIATFQNTPDFTGTWRATYGTPVDFGFTEGQLNLNTLVSFRTETSQFEVESPLLDQPAFALWDASIRYDDARGNWFAMINAKNILNEEYIIAGYDFVAEGPNNTFTPTLGLEGSLLGFFGDPRTVTFTIGINY